jgi:hypothetical protein
VERSKEAIMTSTVYERKIKKKNITASHSRQKSFKLNS